MDPGRAMSAQQSTWDAARVKGTRIFEDDQQQPQNDSCKRPVGKRQLQTTSSKTTVANDQQQNDSCKTTVANDQQQNDSCKRPAATAERGSRVLQGGKNAQAFRLRQLKELEDETTRPTQPPLEMPPYTLEPECQTWLGELQKLASDVCVVTAAKATSLYTTLLPAKRIRLHAVSTDFLTPAKVRSFKFGGAGGVCVRVEWGEWPHSPSSVQAKLGCSYTALSRDAPALYGWVNRVWRLGTKTLRWSSDKQLCRFHVSAPASVQESYTRQFENLTSPLSQYLLRSIELEENMPSVFSDTFNAWAESLRADHKGGTNLFTTISGLVGNRCDTDFTATRLWSRVEEIWSSRLPDEDVDTLLARLRIARESTCEGEGIGCERGWFATMGKLHSLEVRRAISKLEEDVAAAMQKRGDKPWTVVNDAVLGKIQECWLGPLANSGIGLKTLTVAVVEEFGTPLLPVDTLVQKQLAPRIGLCTSVEAVDFEENGARLLVRVAWCLGVNELASPLATTMGKVTSSLELKFGPGKGRPHACGLADLLRRQQQMLKFSYVQAQQGEAVVGVVGDNIVAVECYVIQARIMRHLLSPYVTDFNVFDCPDGAILVSWAFQHQVLVLIHHLMHSAHYCRSTNFNRNEFVALWLDTELFADTELSKVVGEIRAVDVGEIRGCNRAAPVCRLEVDKSEPRYLNMFAPTKAADKGGLRLDSVRASVPRVELTNLALDYQRVQLDRPAIVAKRRRSRNRGGKRNKGKKKGKCV